MTLKITQMLTLVQIEIMVTIVKFLMLKPLVRQDKNSMSNNRNMVVEIINPTFSIINTKIIAIKTAKNTFFSDPGDCIVTLSSPYSTRRIFLKKISKETNISKLDNILG